MSAGPARSIPYRADVDGLRAIAVMLVLVFHFDLLPRGGQVGFQGGFQGGFNGGFIGVDVFFVISGFLITSLVTRQLDEGTFTLRRFYANRIRRLAPALLVVLLLAVVAGLVCLFPRDLVELSKQALLSQLYVVNVYFWRNVSYFGLNAGDVFLLHTWSLAVEEQFYLLYPLAIMALHRFFKRQLWAALALVALGSFALNIAFVTRKPEAVFYLLPARGWELLAGALASFVVAARGQRSKAIDQALGLLGIGAVLGAALFYDKSFSFPGFYALLPVCGAAAILISGARHATLVSRTLSLPPVVYVGRISYSLYLVHWPIRVMAQRLTQTELGASARFGLFALSLLSAVAIYHAVENPFRHRRVVVANQNLMRVYVGGLAVTVLLFVAVQRAHGLAGRFPREVIRLAGYVDDKSPPLTECEFAGQTLRDTTSFCRIGVPDRAPRYIVYGDSHAWAAHAAFDRWLAQKGEAGVFMFMHSCPPLMGLHVFSDRGACFAFNRAIADFLAAHAEIEDVVLVSTWHQADEGRLTTSPEILLSQDASVRLFDERFAETVKYLDGLHRRVHIWEPVPGARGNVPLSLARAALWHQEPRLEIPRAQYLADNAFFFAALDRNRGFVTNTFSPSAALCRSGQCAVVVDGVPAYFDNSHITQSSAGFWVRMLQQEHEPQPSAAMVVPARRN